jgi:hypothetical protein
VTIRASCPAADQDAALPHRVGALLLTGVVEVPRQMIEVLPDKAITVKRRIHLTPKP